MNSNLEDALHTLLDYVNSHQTNVEVMEAARVAQEYLNQFNDE